MEKIKHEIESVRMCDRRRVPAGMGEWGGAEEFLQNTRAYLFPCGAWPKAPPQADMAVNFKGPFNEYPGLIFTADSSSPLAAALM